MKVREMRELNADDLRTQERDLQDQIFRLRIQKAMGQVESANKIRSVRRDLARIKTILQEKTRATA
jgi:large subunit ribosomal protein L29